MSAGFPSPAEDYIEGRIDLNKDLIKHPFTTFYIRVIGDLMEMLSNNDGCVVARSNEAKMLGIKMGVPYFQIEHRIEGEEIAVFSSNYCLYGDMSLRVMEALNLLVPEVEAYSISVSIRGFDVW